MRAYEFLNENMTDNVTLLHISKQVENRLRDRIWDCGNDVWIWKLIGPSN